MKHIHYTGIPSESYTALFPPNRYLLRQIRFFMLW